MDRDPFLMTVYCLVEEHYRHLTAACPLRHGGVVPQWRDVEVITRVLGGALFKLSRDMALVADFRAPYRSFFPALTERALFVRQAAHRWPLHAAIPRRRVQVSRHAADLGQVLDTRPLPVCTDTRGGRRDHCFPGQADYGDCAAKQLHDSGFKGGLRVPRCGLITHDPLLAARPHDLQGRATLVAGDAGGVLAAAKGFLDQDQHALRAEPQGLHVVTALGMGQGANYESLAQLMS